MQLALEPHKSLEDLRGFPAGSRDASVLVPGRKPAYARIGDVPRRLSYWKLGRYPREGEPRVRRKGAARAFRRIATVNRPFVRRMTASGSGAAPVTPEALTLTWSLVPDSRRAAARFFFGFTTLPALSIGAYLAGLLPESMSHKGIIAIT